MWITLKLFTKQWAFWDRSVICSHRGMAYLKIPRIQNVLPILWALVTGETAEKPQAQPLGNVHSKVEHLPDANRSPSFSLGLNSYHRAGPAHGRQAAASTTRVIQRALKLPSLPLDLSFAGLT